MQIQVEANEYFKPWSGGKDTWNKLINADISERSIWSYLESVFEACDNVTDTALNDYLWFQRDEIYNDFNLDENGNVKEA